MRGRTLAALLVATGLVLSTSCGTVKTRYYMAEGNKLYKGERYEQAIEVYKKILGYDPTNWPASYQIAMSYLAMYHPGSTHEKDLEYADKSIEAFEKLLKMEAPDTDTAEKIRNYYVATLRAADKTEKVVSYYQTLLKADPSNGMYIGQLAEIFAKKGDFENALKWYRKRTEVEPKNKEAWYTVGVVCWERSYRGGPLVSDEERAQVIALGQENIAQAMKLDPDYFEAMAYEKLLWLEKAKLAMVQEKPEDAQAANLKATEVNDRIMALLKKRKEAQAAGQGSTDTSAPVAKPAGS